MIEFLTALKDNCWLWFLENKDAILAWFMSGQAVSVVASFVMLIKNAKQIKGNTDSTNTLNGTLENTNVMKDDLDVLKEKVVTLANENEKLSKSVVELETDLSQSNKLIANKLDAIIEVQSIVYSTIRDDSVRQTVNTILNNARYSDTNFKEQLESEISGLKAEFETKMADISKGMTDAIDKVSNSVNAGETAKMRAQELKGLNETMRY
jgi:hypothetical protein